MTLTAAIYNADHQAHIDNQTPQMTDDYAVDNAQMQSTTDPGEVGTESKATTLAGELERLRFAIKELKQWCLGTIAQWYESPTAQAVVSEDARTNSVAVGLTVTRTTTGVEAAGIGTRVLLRGESADEKPSDFAALDAVATTVGAGAEVTVLDILLRLAGAALAAVWRFRATGAFRGIFTHANTADRTYTLPDANTTLSGNESGTWSDVTGSRTKGTVYQNTSGKMRRVSAVFNASQVAQNIGKFEVGSANPPTLIVAQAGQTTGLSGGITGTGVYALFGMVPNNWYYRVDDAAGTVTITIWFEMDE